MDTTLDSLSNILERISTKRILVIGDVMLDRYIWGRVDRISPEAPVPVVQVKEIEDRLGGAGLVVRNLRNLGAQVNVCGLVGDDEEGEIVRKLLREEGSDLSLMMKSPNRPTTLKTRVVAHSQQVVRIDREDTITPVDTKEENTLARVLEDVFLSHDAVVISDYGKGVVSTPLMQALADLTQRHQSSLSLHPVVLDPHPVNYSLYEGGGITIAKPNRPESEAAAGMKIRSRSDAEMAALRIIRRWQLEAAMVTLGEDGLLLAYADEKKPSHFLATEALAVFDVSGAGDAVTSVFAASLVSGATPEEAGYLANVAAGIVVSEVGTVPIRKSQLVKEIQSQFLL